MEFVYDAAIKCLRDVHGTPYFFMQRIEDSQAKLIIGANDPMLTKVTSAVHGAVELSPDETESILNYLQSDRPSQPLAIDNTLARFSVELARKKKNQPREATICLSDYSRASDETLAEWGQDRDSWTGDDVFYGTFQAADLVEVLREFGKLAKRAESPLHPYL
jgi:hypothetical protein